MIWGYVVYLDYERKHYFVDEDRIERITGVRLPDMDIVEYQPGYSRIMEDYSDCLLVEFEEVPSEDLYHKLDSLIHTEKTSWRRNGDVYEFSMMWGNGMSAPKGESDDEDRIFSISFEQGSKKAMIHSGMW